MTGSNTIGVSADELAKILELVEASDFDSIELRIGDLHFAASRHGPLTPSSATAEPVAAARFSDVSGPAKPSSGASQAVEKVESEEDLIEVTAPIVGIFYVAPEPGAVPFVQEGDRIGPDSTLGLIEVMKVFNAVPAGVSGVIVRRLVEDSELVEHGQPLFLVRPEGT